VGKSANSNWFELARHPKETSELGRKPHNMTTTTMTLGLLFNVYCKKSPCGKCVNEHAHKTLKEHNANQITDRIKHYTPCPIQSKAHLFST